MIAEVYDAAKSAGADEDKAAATAVAGQWEIEAGLGQIDKRVDKVENRLERPEATCR